MSQKVRSYLLSLSSFGQPSLCFSREALGTSESHAMQNGALSSVYFAQRTKILREIDVKISEVFFQLHNYSFFGP